MDGGLLCMPVLSRCVVFGWSRVVGEDCLAFADGVSHVAKAIERGAEREGVEPQTVVGCFWCT